MIEELVRKSAAEVPPYMAVKSIETVAREYGLRAKNVIKLASNENPLGASKKAVEAIKKFASKAHLYPDTDASELREAIAKRFDLKSGNVIVGNGSDEIIELAIKLFLNEGEEAIVPSPTFSFYANLAKLYGGRIITAPLDKEFNYDANAVLAKTSVSTKLIFVCSPNNPTGGVITEDALRRILQGRAVVILDEAYAEFADSSLVNLIREYENLIVLRTFSKAFGLAGLRVGYGIACEKVIEYMLRIKPPFNVNTLAQKAALAALSDRAHLKKSIATVKEGRRFIAENLKKLGIKTYPSQANFLLLNFGDAKKTAKEVAEKLLRKGIITRECGSFGLNDNYLRVSIGTKAQNKKFIAELKKLMS